MDELPQETICAIASYLYRPDLCNFSLISRAFVAESQRQLFRTVSFHHHHEFLGWYRKITPTHPVIPSYIRTFAIRFGRGFFATPAEDGPTRYTMASEMFASFTKLEEIHLRNLRLGDSYQLSMLSYFSVSAPSIRSLQIRVSQCSPGLMANFIYLFPHLDDLHTELIFMTDDKPYDLPTPSPSFQGRGRLTLIDRYCLHLPLFPLRFKHLYITSTIHTLSGDLVRRKISALNDLFVTCAPTLEHIILYEHGIPPVTPIEALQAIDLSPCKRLQTLKFKLTELIRCPPHVAPILTSLQSNPSLEAIDIVFCSSGGSLDGLRWHQDQWDLTDIRLCRLAELQDGRLRVSVGFNGFAMRQDGPLLIDFGAFMENFRRSPYPLTILCDSKVVTHRDPE